MNDTRKSRNYTVRILSAAVFAILFQISSAGADVSVTTLVTFDGTNGYLPQDGLVQGRDGNFYGTLSYGGWHDLGTAFRITPNGACVILVTFDGENGSHPDSLILGKDGNFYGTTLQGGPEGSGSVFKMTRDGVVTTLAAFSAYSTGFSPGSLIQGQDGNFYGVTHDGGAYAYGTVFKMSPDGKLTTLVAFNKSNGAYPGGLVQDKDGSLYGSTSQGTPGLNGSTFKFTLGGELTVPAPNRVLPGAGGMKAKDGNFYGTTFAGRADGSQGFGFGSVFKTSPAGLRTTLVEFNQTNGANPLGDLVQGADGNIYGITTSGGAFNQGTVFRLNLTAKESSATTVSQRINVPVLLHAVSNKVDPRILDAMQGPIEFFGKVVDENSNVLSSADIAFRWTDFTARGFECSATAQSDFAGLFSLRGQQGASMTVSVGKAGYYGTHSSQQTFKYSKIDGRYSPDSRNPEVFRLRKQGKGEPLLEVNYPPGMGQIAQLRGDGTPIEINLLTSEKVAPGSGQVKLEFWRDSSEKNARTFDWNLHLSVPGGGLRETDEEFPFAAPGSRYEPSIVINMPKTNQNWRSEVRSRYYIHLSDGKYGRIEFYLLPYNGVFSVKSTINPSGSQNLEAVH